jgi:hypothetical protein
MTFTVQRKLRRFPLIYHATANTLGRPLNTGKQKNPRKYPVIRELMLHPIKAVSTWYTGAAYAYAIPCMISHEQATEEGRRMGFQLLRYKCQLRASVLEQHME